MARILFLFTLFTFVPYAQAAVEINQFSDPQHEARYKKLIDELRCLVCQNQNLADSNAELAQDLRAQVYKMIEAGDSDQEIIDFMVMRYGDFVLYKPPFKLQTALLWAGPFLLLIIGLGYLIIYLRRQASVTEANLTTDEQQQANALLGMQEDENK
jgi:cytochrome c-type biogenesis protein CcmH